MFTKFNKFVKHTLELIPHNKLTTVPIIKYTMDEKTSTGMARRGIISQKTLAKK